MKSNGSVHGILRAVLFTGLLATAQMGFGQASSPELIGGLEPVVPAVPQQIHRPPEGPESHQRWQVQRSDRDSLPSASFVDSLKGNDAAFHVVVDQGKLLTVKQPIASAEGRAAIAVGDPTIVEFEVMPNPRMIRVIGLRAGISDLSITTADGEVYNFEIHVGWDLDLLHAHLKQLFPDAHLKLGQIRQHIVVEGEARSPAEVSQIIQTIQAFLLSVQPVKETIDSAGLVGDTSAPLFQLFPNRARDEASQQAVPADTGVASEEAARIAERRVQLALPQVINLIRVPGVQQVMLQVRIAELNRTAAREIGADWFFFDDETGTTVGTQIGGAGLNTNDDGFIQGLAVSATSTIFAVFPQAEFQTVIRALRRNSILKLLAEPNLIAMSGHQASFLAGGQFPVPVASSVLTQNVIFKDFGVQLNFIPYVLDDETIRLRVEPEVSSIDFSIGTPLEAGGVPVPGLNTRKAQTTVELRQGQTLAIAGLLQVDLDARTERIPGLGDLPYLGPFFSNTTHERVEKELLVLVTPYLIAPMLPHQVPPLPGADVQDPNDLELYLLNRIEGRTGQNFHPTTSWDDPLGLVELMKLEKRYTCGTVGFSETPN